MFLFPWSVCSQPYTSLRYIHGNSQTERGTRPMGETRTPATARMPCHLAGICQVYIPAMCARVGRERPSQGRTHSAQSPSRMHFTSREAPLRGPGKMMLRIRRTSFGGYRRRLRLFLCSLITECSLLFLTQFVLQLTHVGLSPIKQVERVLTGKVFRYL